MSKKNITETTNTCEEEREESCTYTMNGIPYHDVLGELSLDEEESSDEDSVEDFRYEYERMEIWKMDKEESFEKLVEQLEDWYDNWDCEFTDYQKLKLISIIMKN